jgi:pSer/pThr/pTyr-binding forkhead associated (FHA) protein
MIPSDKVLGIMKPLGGGDPIPLLKESLTLGRRPSCDICLDFENVSGKHCELRLINGVWHVRDLGSTNGTTVNGSKISTDQSIMPDVEVGIADHIFMIDYEPSGPASISKNNAMLAEDEDITSQRKRTSLMELAGLDTDDKPIKTRRPARAPQQIERLSADEADFEDTLPEHFKAAPTPPPPPADDGDFLSLFEDDKK